MFRLNPLRAVFVLIGISYSIRAAGLRRQLNEIDDEMIHFGTLKFWLYALFSFGLSCFAGVCSGLTIGYMSISKAEMEIWANSEEQDKKKMANSILQILNNHHFLLSTLLLSNALALQALPIFLDKIVPSYLAIFISTAAVVIFGEVLPQSYCTGSKKTIIGYYMSPFVRFLQCILYPFVKPIVMILDHLVEHDEGKIILDHEKIKNVLLLHNKKQYGYRPQQIQMLQNCLDLRLVNLKQVMIPIDKVTMVEADAKIDEKFVDLIIGQNFSKIPVYESRRENVIGFMKTKNIMQFDIQNPISLRQGKAINEGVFINSKQSLLDAIDILKTKKINFAILVNDSKKCEGIITLKQIFDKIVLKKFKDDQIRVHIHLNKHARIDSVMQAKQQD